MSNPIFKGARSARAQVSRRQIIVVADGVTDAMFSEEFDRQTSVLAADEWLCDPDEGSLIEHFFGGDATAQSDLAVTEMLNYQALPPSRFQPRGNAHISKAQIAAIEWLWKMQMLAGHVGALPASPGPRRVRKSNLALHNLTMMLAGFRACGLYGESA